MPGRPLVVVVGLALALPLVLVVAQAPAHAATPVRPYDFNGDGFPELAVGAPGLPVATHPRAGGVFVLPASASGVASRGAQLVTAASPGVVGTPHDSEHFGDSVASGDFDGDGFADLAIGRPITDAGGAVTVVYGSAKGLTGNRSQELVEPGEGRTFGSFGSVLAAGDLDGDGRADLAAGMPYAPLSSPGEGYGQVALFRSSAAGLSQPRSSMLHGRTGAPGATSGYDVYFGSTLAVGDVDSDGRPDLVVGSRGSSASGGPEPYAGSVDACYGTAPAGGGPTTCSQLAYDLALADPWSLAVGSFTGTSRPEIVLGVVADDGYDRVQVLSLSGNRASTTVSRTELTENALGVPGTDEEGDELGRSLALGDLDHDGFADLVVGAPGEGTPTRSGRVIVVYGGAAGYRRTGGLSYAQGAGGTTAKPEDQDRFGVSLSLVDHDRDGHPDLTVGAPGENGRSGAVTTLDGAGTGFTTQGSRTIYLSTLTRPTSDAALGDVLGH